VSLTFSSMCQFTLVKRIPHRSNVTYSWACGREILQCYFPDAMRRLVRDKWPKMQIFNEFLDYPAMRQSGSFLMTFPASNMVSLKLHNRVSGQACEPLHRFLTACVNLKELALYDLKSPFEPTGGRLPASKLSKNSWITCEFLLNCTC